MLEFLLAAIFTVGWLLFEVIMVILFFILGIAEGFTQVFKENPIDLDN